MTDEECHCEPRFFALFLVIASLVFFVWRSNLVRLLRRFAPRGDKVWVSLRGCRFALLLCHCELVFSLPKQSQRLGSISLAEISQRSGRVLHRSSSTFLNVLHGVYIGEGAEETGEL